MLLPTLKSNPTLTDMPNETLESKFQMNVCAVKHAFLKHRLFLSALIHFFAIVFAYSASFLIRFELSIPLAYEHVLAVSLPILLLCRMVSFYYFKIFQSSWRLVSIRDVIEGLKAVMLGSVLFVLVIVFSQSFSNFPRSILILEPILTFGCICGARLATRYQYENERGLHIGGGKNVLVVGAGKTGSIILSEIHTNRKLALNVVGFVDDDPYLKGTKVQGVRVLGSSADIPNLVERLSIEEMFIAIPSANYKEIARIRAVAESTGVKTTVLRGVSDLIRENASYGLGKEVSCDELLGRRPIKFKRHSDISQLTQEVNGKAVMVTGAGGSIGSELCRQVADLSPRTLILYERYETSLYELELEIKKNYPKLRVLPVVGDVLDREKIDKLLREHNVNLIYHAAAYKHVPLMEREPVEAVRNNVLGSLNVAELAVKNRVEKFVLISTDKAVRPSSIMGTTKRVAELIIRALSGSGTKFVAVRFGNVLGSNGSVIPIFKKQIAQGGPITVTHAETSRYFMAISEAVQLVMVAGSMGNTGEVFLLDMGEPVKIVTLAERLIALSGLEAGKDIDIVFSGLRPGEKLHEELYWRGKGIVPTENKKITVWRSEGPDREQLFSQIASLTECIQEENPERVIQVLREIVPEATISVKVEDWVAEQAKLAFEPVSFGPARENKSIPMVGLREVPHFGELAVQQK